MKKRGVERAICYSSCMGRWTDSDATKVEVMDEKVEGQKNDEVVVECPGDFRQDGCDHGRKLVKLAGELGRQDGIDQRVAFCRRCLD